jgi:hypothetical protein
MKITVFRDVMSCSLVVITVRVDFAESGFWVEE